MSKRSWLLVSCALVVTAGSAYLWGCDGNSDVSDATCTPSTNPFTPPAFVPAQESAGACAATDITGFINSCGATARTAIVAGGGDTCSQWIATSLAGKCGACLVNAENNGAILVDVSGAFQITDWVDSWIGTNTFSCTQLLAGDAGCAKTAIALDDCENAACDYSCAYAEDGAYANCSTESIGSGGVCAATYTSALANCGAFFDDAGVLTSPSACYPAGGENATLAAIDANLSFIANLICGAAQVSDGGAPGDAGDAGNAADASAPDDAGTLADAGGSNDASTLSDAGSSDDASKASDAVAPGDANVPDDAGGPSDGGGPEDAAASG